MSNVLEKKTKYKYDPENDHHMIPLRPGLNPEWFHPTEESVVAGTARAFDAIQMPKRTDVYVYLPRRSRPCSYDSVSVMILVCQEQ